MERPKLSYFLRDTDHQDLGRFRTRSSILLGEQLSDLPLQVVGLGWEGDKFVVNVE